MKDKRKLKRLKAIDFFCGVGGMTYGLTLSGIKVLTGIDIDATCQKTYELNNPTAKFINADIRELSETELVKLTNIKQNDDRLIFIGCSPCQYWTRIRTNKLKAAKTKSLLLDFQRFVNYFKPGFVVFENVPGIFVSGRRSKITQFLKFLSGNSYTVDYGIINANLYGVPQARRRFLLIASRVRDNIRLPKPKKANLPVVRDYIGVRNGFMRIKAGYRDTTTFIHTAAGLSKKNLRRLKLTPHDGGTRISWKGFPELQIPAYTGKDNSFVDTYGRMFWDKPAPTITTKFFSISNGRFAHPDEDRGISLREGATLQTFPRKYKFNGKSISSIARQIGNAVPPQLAKKIGCAILENQ